MHTRAALVAITVLFVFSGCSSSTTNTPPPPVATQTYWTTFDGNPPNPNVEGAGFPINNSTVPSVVVNASAGNMISNAGYMLVDASGRLWVENFRDPVVVNIFSLPLTATSTPVVTLTFPNIHSGFGMVFDSAGNVWMAAQTASSVYKFNGPFTTSASLSSPSLTLTASLAGPQGLAMDAAGDLIVAQGNVGTGTGCVGSVAIFKAPISNTTPVLLNGPNSPDGVAVDSAGNIYAGGQSTVPVAGCVSGVARFSAANQANGASPDIVDATGLPAGFGSEALSIDPLGNLYYANCGTTGNIIVFPNVATGFSATLAPTVVFSDTNIVASTCVGSVAFR